MKSSQSESTPANHSVGVRAAWLCLAAAAAVGGRARSTRSPVYSIPNTEHVSIGRLVGCGVLAPSPPPPLHLKFQQRGAKQARATFPAIYCVNQCATAAYRASRAAHSLHQPTSMGAKSGSLRKVLPFAFSCRRRTGLTEQQPALVLVSALLQPGRSRGSCRKRRTAQADGLHDGSCPSLLASPVAGKRGVA